MTDAWTLMTRNTAAFLLTFALIPGAAFSQAPATPATRAPADVKTPAAPDDKEVSALIGADEEATLSSQMAGRIKRLNVGIGDSFGRGTVLVEFECPEQEARFLSAQSELVGARETHTAKLRLQGLGAAGELEVTLAAAAVEKARAQMAVADAQLGFCKVTAPYAGRVARIKAKAYETVASGQPLLDVVSQSRLKAQLLAPAAWLAWLKPGQPVNIRIRETGRDYSARVTKLNSRVDAVNQAIEVEVRFDGKSSAGLLPGMVGIATFPDRPK
jgi:RND family efflux transporter MFP subunit